MDRRESETMEKAESSRQGTSAGSMQSAQGQRDALDAMLFAAYETEPVPDAVKLRLKNRLAVKELETQGTFSVWWLPAAAATLFAAVAGLLLCIAYVLVNVRGQNVLMPNLLHMASRLWLTIHLAALALCTLSSWAVTAVGLWKAELRQRARI